MMNKALMCINDFDYKQQLAAKAQFEQLHVDDVKVKAVNAALCPYCEDGLLKLRSMYPTYREYQCTKCNERVKEKVTRASNKT